MRRICAALVAVALIAPAEGAAEDSPPRGVRTQAQATRAVLEHPKVARWLERYPERGLVTFVELRPSDKLWEVKVFSGKAGQVATGRVARTGQIVEAFVGPEVAWPLARGKEIGGAINRPLIWLSFCMFFLIGLGDLKRLRSMRNFDLLAALSFSVTVALVNEGHVFASAIAAAAALAYLIARCTWIGLTQRVSSSASAVPVWLLVAALVLLVGFRVGLNTQTSHTLDVGYAGVIGADRLANGETPYGNFPRRETGRPCGPAKADGDISDWVQENGRCETANHLGDTYGPVNYHAYLPGLWLFGWSGKWDSLPAVHFTTILFDVLAMLGLAAIGLRFGGQRLAVTLAFAWAAYPFTQYVSSTNTNDAIMPAFLIWGFWAATSHGGRGIFAALASWTKLAALIVVPLWLTYPARERRPGLVFAGAFAVTTALSFWVLVLSGDPLHEIRVFYERTFEIQADRNSPFSLWDWGDYHAAGLPDLKWAQRLLQVVLIVAALALAAVPRRKTPLQLAAFTAALLLLFELTLTHWFAAYVVWFFPFVLLATLAGDALRRTSA